MTKHSYAFRFLAIFAIAAGVSLFSAPSGRADIIHVENPTACSGMATLCAGSTPFSLTALLNGTEQLKDLMDILDNTVTVGDSTVPTYLIQNDTGKSSFTLVFNFTLANNAFINCQNGFGACDIKGTLAPSGTVTYGPPSGLANGTTYSGTVNITFDSIPTTSSACPSGSGNGCFDLTFASFAHAGADVGTVIPSIPTTTPEPAGLALLGSGLVVLGGLLRRKSA